MSLTEITINDLDADQRTLAECIGMDAYINLLKHYAGSYIYVHKPDSVTKSMRNTRIRNEFNGANYQELAAEFGLSEMTIRRVVSPASSPKSKKKRRRTSKKSPRSGKQHRTAKKQEA